MKKLFLPFALVVLTVFLFAWRASRPASYRLFSARPSHLGAQASHPRMKFRGVIGPLDWLRLKDDSNTVNQLPLNNAAFTTNLQNFLGKENANRDQEHGFVNYVDNFSPNSIANACLGTTGAGLTMALGNCIAYNAGYRSTCGIGNNLGLPIAANGTADCPGGNSITFANNSVTWVAMDENTTGNNAGIPNFTRVTGTHYLTDAIDIVAPAMAADSQLLMQVTTANGSITAVRDLRVTSPIFPVGPYPIPVTGFGVVADGRYVFDAAGNGTTTVSSTTVNTAVTGYGGFSSARDVGKSVTAVNPATGAVLANTTIVSVTNATTIVLGATVANIGSSTIFLCWGTDNSTNAQIGIDAIELNGSAGVSPGGTLYWPRPKAIGLFYYFATTTGLQMNGSTPTIVSQSRPVSMIGDPGTAVGDDNGFTNMNVSTFLFPAIPVTAPNVAATAGFLNYIGAVGCLTQAKLQDLGFLSYDDGTAGVGQGPVAINVTSQDGVFLGTQGHPLYFGPTGGGIQFVNAPNIPSCSIAVAGNGYSETDEIHAYFEYSAQAIRYIVQIGAITTTTSGPITLGSTPVTIPVVSTTGFPPSNAFGIGVTVLNAAGGAYPFLGPNVACFGVTSNSLTGCVSGDLGTIGNGATIAMTGHPSFNGTGCRFCYINRYNTPPGLASIYFGPNSNVYDAPMDVHFFGNGSTSVLFQNDSPGIFGAIPWLYGTITGEGGGFLGTGIPFRLRGQTLVNQMPGSLWASNDLAAESGVQRNLIPNSEANGSTSWSLSDWVTGAGVLPDGGNGFLLTGTGATATPIAVSTPIAVDGNQVTGGQMTAGSTTLYSASGAWDPTRDLYKFIQVPGAGPSPGGSAGTVVGQIIAVPTSAATSVVLNIAAANTVTNATVNWGQEYSVSAYTDQEQGTVVGGGGYGPMLVLTTGSGTLLAFAGFSNALGPGDRARLEISNIIPPTNSVRVEFSANGAVIASGRTVTFSEPLLEATAYPMAYVPSVIFPTPLPTPPFYIGAYTTSPTPEIVGIPCNAAVNGLPFLITNQVAGTPAPYMTPVATPSEGEQAWAWCDAPTFSFRF